MQISPIVLLHQKGEWRTYSATVTSESRDGVVYLVLIHRHSGGAWKFECSCPAGEQDMLCKHVLKVYNRLLLSGFKPAGARKGLKG